MILGIFVEPEGLLRLFIERWKQRFESALPGQRLTAHPPHCTLIAAACLREDGAIAALTDAIDLQPFSCSTVASPRIFGNDSMAGGGQTAVVEIAQCSRLNALQMLVADTMRRFIDREVAKMTAGTLVDPAQSASQARFGFAFAGNHWIPHFTIGSLQVERSHPLLREFESEVCEFTFRVSMISAWRISAGNHERIATIALREG